jgi:succinate dehydrogenase/fumarate reductase flavoprotein subunit
MGNGVETRPRPVVRERQTPAWDASADVIVVGGGAGGLVAAVAAADAGADVIVLERAAELGGTTGKSGGGAWVPNNRFMREAGDADDREGTLRFMARLARPTRYQPDSPTLGLEPWEFEQLAAFFDEAAATFERLEEIGGLQQFHLPSFPDYYVNEAEGRAKTGHLIVPRRPDGAGGDGHEMIRQLTGALEQRGASLRTEHHVVSAIVDDDDRVIGLVVDTPEGTIRVGAQRGVIFASGGFIHNRELRESFLYGPVFGGSAVLGNEGDFVPIAQTLGAAMRNMSQFWGVQILLDRVAANDPQTFGTWFLVGDSVLLVNRYGARVMNEKESYNERVRQMFEWNGQRSEYPNLLSFAIWDQRTQDSCGGNSLDDGLVPGPQRDRSHVVEGQTLPELAAALDARLASFAPLTGGVHLDEDFVPRVTETVERFNGFARAGRDEEFHRGETLVEQYFNNISLGSTGNDDGPTATARLSTAAGDSALDTTVNRTMHPLSPEGPYYAAILVPGALDTKGGALTDVAGQVIGHTGAPIAGLYAVGNCAASPSGQGYWGPGTTFGLIMTQAWRTGRAVAQDA